MTTGEVIANASVNLTLPELAEVIDNSLKVAYLGGQNEVFERVQVAMKEKPVTVQRVLLAVAGRSELEIK